MLTISRGPVLGSSFDTATRTLRFALYSKNATRIELALFDRDRGFSERMRLQMTRDADDVWSVSITLAALAAQGCPGPVYYYGYRAFGPNWIYDPAWQPGSTLGFAADVDNISDADVSIELPSPLPGKRFFRVLDTDDTNGWMTARNNFDGGTTPLDTSYLLHERSILVAIEK